MSAVCSLAILGVPVVNAAPAAGMPVLAGTVVLEGRTSGMVEVRLPRPATFSVGKVTTQGDGRFVGVDLHQELAGRASGTVPKAQAVHFSPCTRPGCHSSVAYPSASGGVYVDEKHAGGAATLPAGVYELSLIADAAPARVTVSFGGLSGRLVLHPAPSKNIRFYTVAVDTAQPGVTGGPVVYAGGVTHRVAGLYGSVTQYLWADEPLPHEEATTGICSYWFGASPPATLPYQYPCNGGEAPINWIGGNYQVTRSGPLGLVPGYRADDIWWWLNEPAGLDSDGLWFDTAEPVEDLHLQGILIDYPR